MAGHNYVNQVEDKAAQRAFLDVMGQIKALTDRVRVLEEQTLQVTTVTAPATLAVNVQGARLTNVGNPAAEQDVVTVTYLRAFVAAQGAF